MRRGVAGAAARADAGGDDCVGTSAEAEAGAAAADVVDVAADDVVGADDAADAGKRAIAHEGMEAAAPAKQSATAPWTLATHHCPS
jgi:hypothetical protein